MSNITLFRQDGIRRAKKMARNPATPQADLEAMVHYVLHTKLSRGTNEETTFREVTALLAKNPSASPEMLRALMSVAPGDVGENPGIPLLALENPNLVGYLLEDIQMSSGERQLLSFFAASQIKPIAPLMATYTANATNSKDGTWLVPRIDEYRGSHYLAYFENARPILMDSLQEAYDCLEKRDLTFEAFMDCYRVTHYLDEVGRASSRVRPKRVAPKYATSVRGVPSQTTVGVAIYPGAPDPDDLNLHPADIANYLRNEHNYSGWRIGFYEQLKQNPIFPLLAWDDQLIPIFAVYQRYLQPDGEILGTVLNSVLDNTAAMRDEGDARWSHSLARWGAAFLDFCQQNPQWIPSKSDQGTYVFVVNYLARTKLLKKWKTAPRLFEAIIQGKQTLEDSLSPKYTNLTDMMREAAEYQDPIRYLE